jgi:hypothetical protein
MQNMPVDMRDDDRLPWSDVRLWLALALAVIFVLLGLLFVLAPDAGAALFGLSAQISETLSYVVALGIRDIVLGGLIGAMAFQGRRPLAVLLGISAIIPVFDVLLVASVEGFSSILNVLVHALAGGVLATLSIMLFRTKRHPAV